ncbi:LacI family transcriptional regulator [Halobacillus andaensis]|uniref:LacI family transcriptional regulator n=1 Tax=Halobacillus andaensis TaxID=1176239 RepID=A0A917BCI4_HALAA|nr:LacI family DNA-binding transcriptional regulator [Halobacillus andaensis]MBP2006706.1 LacI family transcriptional regulator [Halobacillus andaensis]GGF36016.1 LacI family transcriptional regulator [Halobacillus andaensis]
MTTIKDVAKAANVSISTVSRVLNNSGYCSGSTREKVYKAVEELKFQKSMVATAMIKKKTSTLGLIIPDIKNIFYGELTRAIEDQAHQHGFNVILCNTDNDLEKEAEYLNFLLRKGIDGIIFSTPEVNDRNIKEVMKNRPDLPMILLGSQVENVKLDEVLVDNFEGGYQATEHLLEYGHQRIGYIGGQKDSYATVERYKGYCKALEDHSLQPTDHYVRLDEFKIHSGYHKGKELLALPDRPTAIFAGNDAIAVGVYKAARELDISIPDELSVIGFDDSQFAEIVAPELTTIRTPTADMGEKTVELVVKIITEGKNFKETITFQPTLIERGSTTVLNDNHLVQKYPS